MSTPNNEPDPNDYEHVPVENRCPQCYEDDVDYLTWTEDGRVRCATCGTIYDPNWRRSGE